MRLNTIERSSQSAVSRFHKLVNQIPRLDGYSTRPAKNPHLWS
jgi:hypothetical protein